MDTLLIEAIDRLRGEISDVYANMVLCDIINNDFGLLTISPKYRIDELINEIDEYIKLWNVE